MENSGIQNFNNNSTFYNRDYNNINYDSNNFDNFFPNNNLNTENSINIHNYEKIEQQENPYENNDFNFEYKNMLMKSISVNQDLNDFYSDNNKSKINNNKNHEKFFNLKDFFKKNDIVNYILSTKSKIKSSPCKEK